MESIRNRLAFAILAVVVLAVAVYAVPIHTPYPTASHLAGTIYPLPVTTNQLRTGIVGSQSFVVGIATATQMGDLTALTRYVEVWVDVDCNYGDAQVAAGASQTYQAAGTLKTYQVATTTPNIYFMGRAASCTVKIKHWY